MNNQKHSQIPQISTSPQGRQRTSIFWILGAALILGLLLAVSGSAIPTASANSHAGPPGIVSVALNDGAAWTAITNGDAVQVQPGGSIRVEIVQSGAVWNSTSWAIGEWDSQQKEMLGTIPDTLTSGCHVENTSGEIRTVLFSINAPNEEGTYDMRFIAQADPECLGVDVGNLILALSADIDGTAPVVTAPLDITVEATESAGTPATDPAIIAFLADVSATDLVDDDQTLLITHDGPAMYPLGVTTTVTFTVTDSAGNNSTEFATVSVVDSTPPVVTAPVDITVEATGPAGTPESDPAIIAFLAGVSATDLVDDDQTLLFEHDGPAMYPLGVTTTVTFSVADSAGNTSTGFATVTVTVASPEDPPANNAPVVTGNSDATTDEGGSVTTDVLSNATDADGDPLTVTIDTQGTNGLASVNSDGTITYTHDGSETTSDSYTYTISDGNGGSDSGVVSITVTPVNDAPVVTGNSDATTDEGGSVTTDVLSNATDADGDPLTVTIDTQGTNGLASVNSDGTITYTHDGSETTSDSYTYTISDGNGGSDSGVVSITVTPVNDAPVVTGNSDATTDEGGSVMCSLTPRTPTGTP